jgi:hypothetical protein
MTTATGKHAGDAETPRSGSVLWEMLNHEMGYQAEEPSLENLILKLFCTDLSAQADPQQREWLEKMSCHAIRQSIRAGLYGDLACRSSL